MFPRVVMLIGLALHVLCPLATSAADTSVRWSEEVALHDGNTLWIQRAQVYGADEWGRAGSGNVKRMEMAFADGKRRVTWSKSGRALTTWPLILDWVDGRPVIVLEAVGWENCSEYDFPPEGLAALRFDSGRWQRIGLSALPRDLKANLLSHTEAIRREPARHGAPLDVGQKKLLQPGSAGNERLAELIEKGSTLGWHSCASLRPPRDPDREASARRIAAALQDASVVDAVVVSDDTRRYPMTREHLERMYGACPSHANGVCMPTDACGESVTDVGPLLNVTVKGTAVRTQLAGYEIVLDRRRHLDIPVQGPQRAVCSPSHMLVLSWERAETFVLFLFTRDGSFIGARRGRIPGLSELQRDGARAGLLRAELTDTSALLTFVSHTQRPERAVERTRVYRVALPDIPSSVVPPAAADTQR